MSFWAAVPAIASFAGDILGGIAGNEAADDITDAQRESTKLATDLARAIYADERALNMPRIAGGNAALEQAMQLTGLSLPRGADITQAFGASIGGPGGSAGGGGGLGGGAVDFAAYARLPENADLLRAYGTLTPANKRYIQSQGFDPNSLGGYVEFMLASEPWQTAIAQGRRPNPYGPSSGADLAERLDPGTPGGSTPAPGAIPAQTPTDIIKATPGYEFRFNEGQRALDAAFSRGGALNSGARAKAAMQYGQDFATNEYDAQFARLMNIIAPGSAAIGNVGNAGRQFGTTVGNANQNQADANAVGSAYKWNSIGNAGKGIAETLGGTDWSKIFGRGG